MQVLFRCFLQNCRNFCFTPSKIGFSVLFFCFAGPNFCLSTKKEQFTLPFQLIVVFWPQLQ